MKKRIFFLTFLLSAMGLSGYSQNPVILTVVQPPPLQADAGIDVQINSGESVAIGGNPSALEGHGAYIYLWSPADGLDDPTIANPLASPEVTTTYLVTVTDSLNCSSVDEVTVTVGASAIETNSVGFRINCYPNPEF